MENIIWLAIKSDEDSAALALVGNGQLVKDANWPSLKICIMIWSRESLALWGMLDAWHSDTGSLLIMYKLIRYELTNMLFMNNYIILLIMREWFCLNALWKVKKSHEKLKNLMKIWKEEVSVENRSCSLKIKVFEVLLRFKDKVSDESTSLC